MSSVIIQSGKHIIMNEDKLTIDGKEIPIPKGLKGNNQSIIDGRIYIDGFEYLPKQNKFKRTLRALFHLIF